MSSLFQKRDQRETEIVDLLRRGDQRAVSVIYQHYADVLFGLIYKIVRSETIAEEVLQDTLVKIWKNAAQYDRSKGRLFTWFANIARNTAIDKVRSATYQREQKTGSTENLVHEGVLGTEETQVADPGLQKVINSLDEKYRVLIELAYFQGYSQREIEKELGIPLGTIKSRLRAAIQELRTKLDNEFVRKLLFAILLVTLLLNYLLQT